MYLSLTRHGKSCSIFFDCCCLFITILWTPHVEEWHHCHITQMINCLGARTRHPNPLLIRLSPVFLSAWHQSVFGSVVHLYVFVRRLHLRAFGALRGVGVGACGPSWLLLTTSLRTLHYACCVIVVMWLTFPFAWHEGPTSRAINLMQSIILLIIGYHLSYLCDMLSL